jgi:hypothetical protein
MKQLCNKEKLVDMVDMEDYLNNLFPDLKISVTYLGGKYHLAVQLPSKYYLTLLRIVLRTWYPEGKICFPDWGGDILWFRYDKEKRFDEPQLRLTNSGEFNLWNFTNLLELKQHFCVLLRLCSFANQNFILDIVNCEK